jgi:uncharacterized protein (DUF1684 family)
MSSTSVSSDARSTVEAVESADITDAFADEWRRWHAERVAALTAPHGFLAVVGLYWLDARPRAFRGTPGQWWTENGLVAVKLSPGEELLLDGEPLTGVHGFGAIAERDGIELVSGDTVVEVAKRGGKYVVRPRNPGNWLLRTFAGIPAYAPDAAWRLRGTYRAFPAPRPTTVGAAVEGIQHVYEAPGEIVFEVGGEEHTLTAFNGPRPGTLNVLFTDATSGRTTYAANRSLGVAAPDADGGVVLDFNRAVNLPCAFTDFATCPLPPRENRLTVAVEAGEKIPYERAFDRGRDQAIGR